ncbi:Lar family restriction alleviation protein [Enterobacter ludwigii]|uniref:Lar family restriction alleviation protein n=1 Tax=Enterobacter ludwigii TaxID=299767 RepID=UPI00387EE0AB
MSELKPCPFCGCKVIGYAVNPSTGWYYRTCRDCAATGPEEIDGDEARKSWNRRSGNEETNV